MEYTPIKLTYESLIGLLQGKELHLIEDGREFIFIPPFDGVFLTHLEIDKIKLKAEESIFKVFQKVEETNTPTQTEEEGKKKANRGKDEG